MKRSGTGPKSLKKAFQNVLKCKKNKKKILVPNLPMWEGLGPVPDLPVWEGLGLIPKGSEERIQIKSLGLSEIKMNMK